jgi:Tfp pilus assembly protein PilF
MAEGGERMPASASPSAFLVQPAVAYEDATTDTKVRQTAGVIDDSTSAVKRGLNKIADTIAPPSTTISSDDPTSLSSPGKPSAELYLSFARYQEQSGQLAEAEQSYRLALQVSPKHLKAHLLYARFKDRQGQSNEAMAIYQKVAKLYPNEAAVYNDVGLFFAKQGKSREAIQTYEKAIKLQPKQAVYRNNLAIVLVDLQQPEKALTQLSAVYNEAEAAYNVGYLLQKKGQVVEAAQYFGKAVEANPEMEEARAWLHHLHTQLSQTTQIARRSTPQYPAAAQQDRAAAAPQMTMEPPPATPPVATPPVAPPANHPPTPPVISPRASVEEDSPPPAPVPQQQPQSRRPALPERPAVERPVVERPAAERPTRIAPPPAEEPSQVEDAPLPPEPSVESPAAKPVRLPKAGSGPGVERISSPPRVERLPPTR